MKKLWIVLLSVALIAAFAMPVCAADVKFSGSYVIQGYYENNRALLKNDGPSVMDTWQRVRMQADFQVQQGLSFTLGWDAFEKIWGASRNATYAPGTLSNVYQLSAGENENIHMNLAYVSANLAGGLLRVGYQRQGQFGTAFGDYGDYAYGPRVRYDYVTGPWTWILIYDKSEAAQYYAPGGPSANIGNSTYQVDQGQDAYVAAFIYTWSKGNAGLLYKYLDDSRNAGVNPTPATDAGYKRLWHIFDPYVKAQIGPVYVEAEVIAITGKTKQYETQPNGTDQTKNTASIYASATYDFAPMYAGLTFVYVPGDDLSTPDKDEAGWPGMIDFNPCLMLFNFDLARWNGSMGPGSGSNIGLASAMNQGITNATVAQVFVGVKPLPKLDIKASYTYATADKDGTTGQLSRDYGKELDITATYKIYDNLSYMVGFGYLWAGDFFKGSNANVAIDNDYLLTHKLTLTF